MTPRRGRDRSASFTPASLDENAPLLEQENSTSSNNGDRSLNADTQNDTRNRHGHYLKVLLLCAAISIVADVGGSLINTPETRLLEMSICRAYYRRHDPTVIGEPPNSYVDEEKCKLPAIQSELAYLAAVKYFLTAIPGLVLAPFYGRAADKYGRKPILLLCLTGQLLSLAWTLFVCRFHQVFPTKAILFGALFVLLGGGNRVMSAVLNTIIVDVAPAEVKTNAYLLIAAAILTTDVLATPIGSWLLSIDLWLPFKISLPIILLSYPVILATPETAFLATISRHLPNPVNGVDDDGSADQNDDTVSIRNTAMHSAKVQRWYRRVGSVVREFKMNRETSLVLLLLFLVTYALQADDIFLLYTTRLLHWSLPKAGLLQSLKSLVHLGVLVCSAVLRRRFMSGKDVDTRRWNSFDVMLVRTSVLLSATGSLALALAMNPTLLISGAIIRSSGRGATQALQGLLAAFVKSENAGKVFSVAAVLQSAASILGAFAFAGLFDVASNRMQAAGFGLPYFISSVLYLFCTVLLHFMQSKDTDGDQNGEVSL